MSIEDLRWGVGLLQWLVMGAIALYAHLMGRNAANAAEVAALRQQLAALEEHVRHLPDQELVHDLAGDVKAVKATLDALREALVPLTTTVDRINNYLLNNK
ncbi:DUF2730 domain-containing protein [Pigmentiphaga kullae]|uniref:DUF2730 family protein n=1 Tax=Pigmentiphaga kullae TaxID=151784 RepID=A0A4V2F418_9BURK|nr:DUF2730 domain-containing protein [Pigmentiphaga kullae]RZS86057.1 hypothetical protein EV675_2091 [Pigmentiphaga kullae]